MTIRPKPLVHIGFHKTGTSWLQQNVFATGAFALPGAPRHQILADVVCPPPFGFSPLVCRAAYAEFIDAALQAQKTPVVSHERLSGYPPSGGYDSEIIAGRLHATFPDARILIGIREQASLIYSMYSQYITDGGELPLDSYLAPPEPHLRRIPAFSLDFYKFDRIIARYMELYGSKNVLILPHELLISEPQTYLRKLSDFCELPDAVSAKLDWVNIRRSPTLQILQRHVNALFSYNQLSRHPLVRVPRVHRRFGLLHPPLGRLVPKGLDQWLSKQQMGKVRERVADCYARSNRLTSDLIGQDLRRHGYQFESNS